MSCTVYLLSCFHIIELLSIFFVPAFVFCMCSAFDWFSVWLWCSFTDWRDLNVLFKSVLCLLFIYLKSATQCIFWGVWLLKAMLNDVKYSCISCTILYHKQAVFGIVKVSLMLSTVRHQHLAVVIAFLRALKECVQWSYS